MAQLVAMGRGGVQAQAVRDKLESYVCWKNLKNEMIRFHLNCQSLRYASELKSALKNFVALGTKIGY